MSLHKKDLNPSIRGNIFLISFSWGGLSSTTMTVKICWNNPMFSLRRWVQTTKKTLLLPRKSPGPINFQTDPGPGPKIGCLQCPQTKVQGLWRDGPPNTGEAIAKHIRGYTLFV